MTAQDQSCKSCRFFLVEGAAQMCRRYPPQIVSWNNPRPRTRDEEIILRSQFPSMLATGWCGEWLPAVVN